MIYDSITNFSMYCALSPYFSQVLEFINSINMQEISGGKHSVGNKGSYALVSEYLTEDISQRFIECHRQFIDIQIVARGTENIGICNKSECAELAYDPDNDFQKLAGEVSFLTMREGNFAIFFPEDGHMPKVNYKNTVQKVKKMVIKVPV